MARQTKVSHKIYSAWNYAGELADLNRASQEGWQLIKGGCFSSRFKKDPSIRYIYQLDFQPHIEDMPRYLETFREQGWEYINTTFNGWSYFRKVYDPALPAEQYEIFTDRSSLQEMHDRWNRVGLVACIFFGLYFLLQLVLMILHPTWPTLIRLVLFGATTAVFSRGVWILKQPERRKKIRWDSLLLAVFFLILLGGNIAALCMDGTRPHLHAVQSAEYMDPFTEPVNWTDFTIPYADNYDMDLKIDASAPVTLTIANAQGKTVCTAADSAAETEYNLRLKKGEYSVYLSDFSGGKLYVELELN